MQALKYFLSEAGLNLVRGWKVSLLAVLTIAVSLYVGGIFLLLSLGVSQSVEGWRSEARVVVYLAPTTEPVVRDEIQRAVTAKPWVASAEIVEPTEAQRRFDLAFPRLAELLGGWATDTLPPSIEIELDAERLPAGGLAPWFEELNALEAVEMVDDDREWLGRVDFFAAVLRIAGLTLGAFLVAAAIFSIASVIRMTAHVYRQEIAVQRLVGGTEFFIRGPFVAEGALQGFLGGLLAAVALVASASWLAAPEAHLIAGLVPMAVPTWPQLAAFVALGWAAGLSGALVSLRAEGGVFG